MSKDHFSVGRDNIYNLLTKVTELYKRANNEREDRETEHRQALKDTEIQKENDTDEIRKIYENKRNNKRDFLTCFFKNHFENIKEQCNARHMQMMEGDDTYREYYRNNASSYNNYDTYDQERLEREIDLIKNTFDDIYNKYINYPKVSSIEADYIKQCEGIKSRYYTQLQPYDQKLKQMLYFSDQLKQKSPVYVDVFDRCTAAANCFEGMDFFEMGRGIDDRYQPFKELIEKYIKSPKRRGKKETRRDFLGFSEQLKESVLLFQNMQQFIESGLSDETRNLTKERDEMIEYAYKMYEKSAGCYRNINCICEKAEGIIKRQIAEEDNKLKNEEKEAIKKNNNNYEDQCERLIDHFQKKKDRDTEKVKQELDRIFPDNYFEKLDEARERIDYLRKSFNCNSDDEYYQMFTLKTDNYFRTFSGAPEYRTIFMDKFIKSSFILPFIWGDSDFCNLLVKYSNRSIKEAQELVCSIIYDYLSLVSNGDLSVSIIDKAYEGKSVSALSTGFEKVPDIINGGVSIEERSISETIDRLYDISNGYIQSEKKELLIVCGYPCGIDDQSDSKLNSIFKNDIIKTVILFNTETVSCDKQESWHYGNNGNYEEKIKNRIKDYEFSSVVFNHNDSFYLEMPDVEKDCFSVEVTSLPDKAAIDSVFMAYSLIGDKENLCDAVNLGVIKTLLTTKDKETYKKQVDIVKELKVNNGTGFSSYRFPRELLIGEAVFERVFFKKAVFNNEINNDLFLNVADDGSMIEKDALFEESRLSVPLIFDLAKIPGIFIDDSKGDDTVINKLTNNIIWSFIETMPKGKSQVFVFDSKHRGQNVHEFLEFGNELPEVFIIDTIIKKMKEDLQYLNTIIDDRIQKKIFGSDNTIFDYNEKAEKTQEKIVLLLVYDFEEHSDDTEYMKLLEGVLENGAKCGIITVLCRKDEESNNRNEAESISKLVNKCLLFKSDGINYYLSDYGINISPYELPDKDIMRSFVNGYFEEYKTIKNKGISFDDILPDKVFEKEASDGLSIPVGIGSGDSFISLNVGGDEDAHHGLIIGGTGSGKSTFLHTLILSGLSNYSPGELNYYLLDFKSGTEFKIYEEHKIPHIKFLGLDAMQEYGVGVLQNLSEELGRRAVLFKREGVQKLSAYNKLNNIQPLPRILILIDEFQVLFDQNSDYKLAAEAEQYASEIIKQGRSFGLHLIMATQSATGISSGLSLNKGDIDQMRLRIGLSCSEEDAKYMFTDDPVKYKDALSKMSGPKGTAVINQDILNQNSDNKGFRIAYCDNESKIRLLSEIEEKSLNEYPEIKCDLQVFDTNKVKRFTDFCSEKAIRETDEKISTEIYIGEPVRMSAPCVITVDNKQNHNLLVCGTDMSMRNNIIENYIISALLNRNTEIICIDGNKIINEPVSDYYSVYKEKFGERFRVATCEKNAFELLIELNNTFEQRCRDEETEDKKDKKYFLILRNYQYLEDFQKMFMNEGVEKDLYGDISGEISDTDTTDDLPEFDFNKAFKTGSYMDSMLETVIKRGRRKGIYAVIDCDDSRIINDSFRNGSYINEFKEKLLFTKDDQDLYSLGINDNNIKMTNLKENMVYYFSSGTPHIIKPFDGPGDTEALKQFFDNVK